MQIEARACASSQGGFAPGARPLYLMTPRHCVVDLDGPALAVRTKNGARVLYPMSRVSRVVSAISVQWQPRALSGCLERGIPIVLLDGSGIPAGYVQPANTARSSLDQLLCELVERSDWHRHCDNWLRAERARAVRTWLAGREARGLTVSDRQRGEVMRRFVYASEWREALLDGSGMYRAALMALACQATRTAGLAASYAGDAGGEFYLVVELCNLLCLALELELEGLGQEAPLQTRAGLLVLDTYMAGLEERCCRILARLHRRATELSREWR